MQNKDLKIRILEISYKYKLSHIGSCLTAVDIIDEIFSVKKDNEKFVLSSGHAGLALYVVLEKYTKGDSTGLVEGLDAEKIFNHHGVHPDRCAECHIDCSSGSLGHGLPIAVGMALADRGKNVYCLVSDGECSEGSIWEALRIKAQYDIKNLKIYLNYNGFSAYQESHPYFMLENNAHKGTQIPLLPWLIENTYRNMTEPLPFLKGLDAHYHVMTEEEYNQGCEILK
jgi:transketolase